MGLWESHRIKIMAGVGGGLGIVAAGVGVVHLSGGKEKKEERVNLPVDRPRAPEAIETNNRVVREDSGESADAKMQKLKGEKTELKNGVSEKIGQYKVLVDGAQAIARLDATLKQCKSIEEITNNVNEEDKKKLKDAYDGVKGDHGKYAELNRKIEGELTEKESKADRNKEDAGKMEEFKTLLEQIKKEYEAVNGRRADQTLKTTFQEFHRKLQAANSACSLKDVIKINDWYGTIQN